MNHSKGHTTLKIIEYHKQGYDTREIADKTNTCYANVFNALKRNGLISNPSKTKLTSEERESMVKEYLNGTRCIDLEKKYGICRAAVLNTFHRRNISVRKDTIQMSDKTKNMIELYKGGLSSKEIAEKLGVRRGTVQVLVNSNGFKGNVTFYRKSKSLNDDYFECIDTEKKAYHLGLLFADGHINKYENKNTIFISLKKQDSYLIEDFKREIEADNPINERLFPKNPTWETQRYFTVSSRKMKQDLIKYGCTPQKSLTAIFPKIDPEFIWHFIRGYFDGDGCIRAYRRSDCRILMKSIIICVSEYFGTSLKDLLSKEFKIVSYLRKQGNIHMLTINRQEHIVKFRDLLYNNSSISMERKKHKFYL